MRLRFRLVSVAVSSVFVFGATAFAMYTDYTWAVSVAILIANIGGWVGAGIHAAGLNIAKEEHS